MKIKTLFAITFPLLYFSAQHKSIDYKIIEFQASGLLVKRERAGSDQI